MLIMPGATLIRPSYDHIFFVNGVTVSPSCRKVLHSSLVVRSSDRTLCLFGLGCSGNPSLLHSDSKSDVSNNSDIGKVLVPAKFWPSVYS